MHRSLYAFLALLLFAAPLFAQETDRPTALAQASETTPTAFDAPELVQRFQESITPADLAAHLFVFASDFFEGRETTARGQKLAAYYLAGQYRKMGLEPKGTAETDHPYDPDAYLQPFDLYESRLREARLQLSVDGQPVGEVVFGPEAHGGDGYLAFGTNAEADGGVVFAGYGIADKELGYDDYAALQKAGITDLSDKWLLVLGDEPLKNDSTSLLPTADGKPSVWTTSGFQKLRAAFMGGRPKGVLMVGDLGPGATESLAARAAERAGSLEGVGSLSRDAESGGRPFPPIYVVSADLANRLLAPTGKTVETVKRQIDESLTPTVFAVPGASATSTITQEKRKVVTENVLAFIEGSDPVLKDEVVVLSSHYDHVGIDESLAGDQIFNGADDDGSGTVTTLEIAEAFMKAKEAGFGPRRSLLFLNVSGEEKGLLGSAYYTDAEPVLPLDKTVTNLNIDMVGRHDPTHPTGSTNYVYIIGSNLISQELHDINLRVNEITGVELELDERFNSKDDPNRFYARSDHWNFGKNNIPFIFFFTGTHDDYHGVGDHPEKIDYDRMARIAQLIFATAWQVANQDAPPALSGVGFN